MVAAADALGALRRALQLRVAFRAASQLLGLILGGACWSALQLQPCAC